MAGINVSLMTAGTAYLEDGSDTIAFVRETRGNFRFLSFSFRRISSDGRINHNGDVVGYYYAFADTNPSEPAQSFRSHATAAGGHKGSVRT